MQKTSTLYTQPIFSAKHYVAIAEMCYNDSVDHHAIIALARLFEHDNPRFDIKRFYQKAGLQL